MTVLFAIYALYLFAFGLVSYAILFHLKRYRFPGDKSATVSWLYIAVSSTIILGSVVLLLLA